jgi:biopolymer transport protein ExbD
VLAIDSNRRLYLNAVPVQKDDLQRRVTEILENKKDRIVIIKADEDVEYGAVMDAMDQLRASGIEDMGLITDPRRTSTTPNRGGE